MIIIAIFLLCKKLREDFNSTDVPKYVAVIVEPRKHDKLEYVVLNVIGRIPDDCKIEIFHGKNAKDFIMQSRLANYVHEGKVKLHKLDVDNLDVNGYNKLLKSQEFWNTINGEKVLIFQTDSVLCGKSNYKLHDFMDYDYIGSNWIYYQDGLGGNGGLSIRDRNKSIECIKKIKNEEKNEDVFFIDCYKDGIVKGKLATKDETYRFGTQNAWKGDKSYGTHRPNLIMPKGKMLEFLEYCPEAKFL